MTSLEFIISNIQSPKWEYTPWPERKLIIEHAQEMHRQEILDAFEEGSSDGFYGWGSSNKEKYYNETFKQ